MDQNTYMVGGSNVHASKLVINKFNKLYQDNMLNEKHIEDTSFENVPGSVLNFKTDEADLENRQSYANSYIQKRKFEDIEKEKNEIQKTTFFSKYPKVSDSSNLKERIFWEHYSTSIKPTAIKSYTSLLHSKSLIPNLMDKSEFSHQIKPVCSVYRNDICLSVHQNKSSLFLVEKNLNSQIIEETFNISNVQNINWYSPFDSNSKYALKENKLVIKCKKMTNAKNDSIESVPKAQIHHDENISRQSPFFPNSISNMNPLKHIDLGEVNVSDREEIFTTASGKSIDISNKAMLAAKKLLSDETMEKIDTDVNCSSIENNQLMKTHTLKKNNLTSCAIRNHKDNEITRGEIDPKSIKNNNLHCDSYDTDKVQFSTAAGQKIDVSEAAMKAAHKLIQSTFENDDKIIPSTSGSFHKTCKKKSAFKDIGCPQKKLLTEDNDNTMDKDLVEMFFQDVVFDEEEPKKITESCKNKDFNKVLVSKTNKEPASSKNKDLNKVLVTKKSEEPVTHKIRKSLGGRRSLRFCSDI